MAFLGLENEQDQILEQFRYMDTDGSGSIDFEEFVTVMTSDMIDQEFFQLQDEKEAEKWDLAFFSFATNFRRQKLIEQISGKGVFKGQSDVSRYSCFETLFQVPVLPSSLQDGDKEAQERIKITSKLCRKVNAQEAKRTGDAKVKLKRDKCSFLKSEHGTKTKNGNLPPFHMHKGQVPSRSDLGYFRGGHWNKNIHQQGLFEHDATQAWDLIKHRKVSLEQKMRQEAARQARQLLGTQSYYMDPFATLKESKSSAKAQAPAPQKSSFKASSPNKRRFSARRHSSGAN